MNRNIIIKLKAEKLKELINYLKSINEDMHLRYHITYNYDKIIYVYYNKLFKSWNWSYCTYGKFTNYSTFMRQKKLERILK